MASAWWGKWQGGRRAMATSVGVGVVVLALIVTVAVTSEGYTAQKIENSDASVWITNQSQRSVGRVNAEISQLNTVLATTAGAVELSQHAGRIIAVDPSGSAALIVDPASASVAESVPLPPGEVQVLQAENRTVVFSPASGNVWFTSPGSFASFDESALPDLTLGVGGSVALGLDSTLFAVSVSGQAVFTIRPGAAIRAAVQHPISIDAASTATITAVGGHWAVLDRGAGRLLLEDASIPLDISAAESAQALLQIPGPDSNSVLVATSNSLVSVSLEQQRAVVLSEGHTGNAAAPVTVAGCSYAAWTDGQVWSRCALGAVDTDSDTAVAGSLQGMPSGGQIEFRVNGSRVLLNEVQAGSAWDVQNGNRLIDNWAELLAQNQVTTTASAGNNALPAQVVVIQQPPVAVDDEVGARPGRSSILNVLANDYDPNSDVVVIDSVSVPDGAGFTVEPVSQGQQLRLTLPDTAAGLLSFDYSISDGRGARATATVTVTVRQANENSAPVQLRTTGLDVATGSRATVAVLGDWVDPDSDPVYLAAAVGSGQSVLTYLPDGRVTFSDTAGVPTLTQVALTVSDGSLAGVGSLAVNVLATGTVPIVADPFVQKVTLGIESVVSPLAHVRGGSGTLRLAAVPSRQSMILTPDFAAGTFRVTAGAVGTVYLEYSVTDSSATATGLVRIEVSAPTDSSAPPVTVPHTAFVRQAQAVSVDVLAGDFDPAGGVLIITALEDTTAVNEARIEIIEQRLIRVTLTGPLDSGSLTFSYTVSNGLASTTGSVTVIEIPPPATRQPPVAADDVAAVRVGDVVSIPVLENDVQPDGDVLELASTLIEGPGTGGGLLFVSGRVLRYLAPSTPGNFAATYRVQAPDGQFSTAVVRIAVREANPAANAAPLPQGLEARVIAGSSVRIPVPLSGIDPDGDSVQLLGETSAPEKGFIQETGTAFIVYRAGEYATGTDTFTYAVLDNLGARATGTIRVGIGARAVGLRNPYAGPDEVRLRPGRTATVSVLANDSDPDGGTLSITSVAGGPGVAGVVPSARVDGPAVVVQAGVTEGRYGFVYEIDNGRGGTSTSFLTVIVDSAAPLSRPVVTDTVLTLSDIAEASTLDADVLARVFFADGESHSLILSVLPGYSSTAGVTAANRLRVSIGETSQIIPFSVTHPDDPGIQSFGFLWVPGLLDALPQLRKGAEPISATSGREISIALSDYVVAGSGRTVRLTDSNLVRAVHSDGSSLVDGDQRLRFTSTAGYFGPASISFEVTDGDTASDSNGNVATLVLPITVVPSTNQPPTFNGALVEFEPGQTKVFDLTKLTTYPYAADQGSLVYQLLTPAPAGFTASQSGQSLSLTAGNAAVKGSRSQLGIGVRHDAGAGRAGRIELSVVASTRPRAIPAPDAAIAVRGSTTLIDVLANDRATNPFPGEPLTVTAVRGIDAASLPVGLSITPSLDRSVLSVVADAETPPGDVSVQYRVLDATVDPDRAAWGTVRISVQDRPAPVTGVQITGFGDRSLAVAFSPGASNNSPIQGFEISLTAPDGRNLGTTSCAATRCTVSTPGNGEAFRAAVQVAPRNAIGLGEVATASGLYWSDIVPLTAQNLRAVPQDGGLQLSWRPAVVPTGGSAVKRYAVEIDSQAVQEVAADSCSETCSVVVTGLRNGVPAAVSVLAKNDALPSFALWNPAEMTAVPFGAPLPGQVQAFANSTGGIDVAWSAFAENGDSVLGYFVQRLDSPDLPSGDQACRVESPAPGALVAPRTGGRVLQQQAVGRAVSRVAFADLADGDTRYSFVVWGYNRAGCVSSAVVSVTPYPSPGPVTSVDGSMAFNGETWDYRVNQVIPRADKYLLQRLDDAGVPVGAQVNFTGAGFPRGLTGGAFGTVYRFQLTACSVWPLVESCGAPFAVNAPEPSLSLEIDGLAYSSLIGQFTWANPPANGTYGAAFSCGLKPDSTASGFAAGNACTLRSPAADAEVWIEITVNGRLLRYGAP
jgi:hypothetical protein